MRRLLFVAFVLTPLAVVPEAQAACGGRLLRGVRAVVTAPVRVVANRRAAVRVHRQEARAAAACAR